MAQIEEDEDGGRTGLAREGHFATTIIKSRATEQWSALTYLTTECSRDSSDQLSSGHLTCGDWCRKLSRHTLLIDFHDFDSADSSLFIGPGWTGADSERIRAHFETRQDVRSTAQESEHHLRSAPHESTRRKGYFQGSCHVGESWQHDPADRFAAEHQRRRHGRLHPVPPAEHEGHQAGKRHVQPAVRLRSSPAALRRPPNPGVPEVLRGEAVRRQLLQLCRVLPPGNCQLGQEKCR